MESGESIGLVGTGELTRDKIEKVRVELMESDIALDCIVVGGLSNSLIRHGPNN